MCDTFIATPKYTKNKTFIFGKNSDREPNEAQSILHIPRKINQEKSLECTYISIPQVKETNAIIISKPFWMWGAEMGINEHGLVIGNEAIFSKISANKKSKVLTGMDLIRLALERTKNADDAIVLISTLIAKYGQGGNGGYKNNLYYFNSFIIADKKSAWVMETIDNYWVAKKIKNYYSISNRLTINNDYDLSSPKIEELVRQNNFIKKNQEFSFKNAFSDRFLTHFSKSKQRLNATCNLAAPIGEFTINSAIKILTSHYEHNFKPYKNYAGGSVCMHANGILNPTQTTGSMIVELSKNKLPKILLTGTSNPCLSLYKPFVFGGNTILENNTVEPVHYFDKTLWWTAEKFHREVTKNYMENTKIFKNDLKQTQKQILDNYGNIFDDKLKTDDYSKSTIKLHLSKISEWSEAIKNKGNKRGNSIFYDFFWKKQNKVVRL